MQRPEFRAHLGVMDSGKSLRLMQHAYEQDRIGNTTIIAKPGIDTKAGEKITSRIGIDRPVDILFSAEDNVRERVLRHIAQRSLTDSYRTTATTLYVDEVQFASVDHIYQMRELATEDRVSVEAYGLMSDFTGTLFAPISSVIANADHFDQLHTACRGAHDHTQEVCGNSAIRNARLVDGEYVFSGETVAIDGEQNITYRSLCDFCFTAVKKAAALKSQQHSAVR